MTAFSGDHLDCHQSGMAYTVKCTGPGARGDVHGTGVIENGEIDMFVNPAVSRNGTSPAVEQCSVIRHPAPTGSRRVLP
ncbi:MAG: hypothetical protein ACR2RL_07880 [Gammaproteobacteria bacterium]